MLRILTVGLGSFGEALVRELRPLKTCEVLVIESDQEKAQQIKDDVDRVIVADAGNREILEQFARDIDVAVVCLGEKIDSSILTTYLLREVGVKRIIAKAISREHGEILKLVGAQEIVFPEQDTARRLALNLLTPDILDLIRLSGDFNLFEIAVPEDFLGKTLIDLQIRKRFGLEVLAVRNALKDETTILPPADYTFRPDDVLIGIGRPDALKSFEGRR